MAINSDECDHKQHIIIESKKDAVRKILFSISRTGEDTNCKLFRKTLCEHFRTIFLEKVRL